MVPKPINSVTSHIIIADRFGGPSLIEAELKGDALNVNMMKKTGIEIALYCVTVLAMYDLCE